MQPVAETISKKKLAHKQFGLGVLAPDPAHVVAPYFGFVNVGHGRELWFTKVVISDKKMREVFVQMQGLTGCELQIQGNTNLRFWLD